MSCLGNLEQELCSAGSAPTTLETLQLAIALLKQVAVLHADQKIHGGINPKRIILAHLHWGDAQLENMSMEPNFWRQSPSKHLYELAFIAPEQTKKRAKIVDHRVDLYSIGVVMYRMLAKQVPFVCHDALEMIHAHQATPLQPIPNIPAIVMELISILMAKNTNERYQCAFGALYDCEKCLKCLSEQQQPITPIITLRERDSPTEYCGGSKIYFREQEVEIILSAFHRMKKSSKAELVHVYGFSGVGKSTVVKYVYEFLADKVSFMSSKFEQYKEISSYEIFSCQQLIREMLSEPENRLKEIRFKLIELLGANCALMTRVIPELAQLVGTCSTIPELGPTETRKRFKKIFASFLSIFATQEKPLVLFIDDIQWATRSSLQILKSIFGAMKNLPLMVILAYRENEMPKKMTTYLHKLEAFCKPVLVQLGPFSRERLADCFRDQFKYFSGDVDGLCSFLYEKTRGVPFDIMMLLTSLYQSGMLYFDHIHGEWRLGVDFCKLPNYISSAVFSLDTFPVDTRRALSMGALVGIAFHLDEIAALLHTTISIAAEYIWPALQTGLVVSIKPNISKPIPKEDKLSQMVFQFCHDQVQQAAYELVPRESLEELHCMLDAYC